MRERLTMASKNILVTTVATTLVLTVASQAQANNIDSYQDYKLYCGPGAYQYGVQSRYCDQYEGIYGDKLQQELDQRQKRRNTQPQTIEEKANRIEPFIGGTIGAFFPTDEFANTGFGGSIFTGANFNRNIGADIEFGYLGGGTDFDDIDYSLWAIFIGPKFMLPLTNKENSSYLYLTPGIGVSQAEVDVDDIASFEDSTRFSYQGKLGISFPVSNRVESFAQARYAAQASGDTVDFFSSEFGIILGF